MSGRRGTRRHARGEDYIELDSPPSFLFSDRIPTKIVRRSPPVSGKDPPKPRSQNQLLEVLTSKIVKIAEVPTVIDLSE